MDDPDKKNLSLHLLIGFFIKGLYHFIGYMSFLVRYVLFE